jgi:PAS domain S-box-containing protein
MGIEIESRSQMAMQQQKQQREKAYAAAATASQTPRANVAATSTPSPTPSTSQTFNTIPQVTEPSTPESNAAKAAGNKKKRKRQAADGQAPLLPAAPNGTSSNTSNTSNYGDPAGMQQPHASQTGPAASVSPEDQMKINYFLLNELRKTKEEQIQMARELQVVKVENHKLNTRMVQAAEGYRLLQMAFRQMHPTYHLNPGAIKIPSSIEGVAVDGNSQSSKGAGNTPFIASSALTSSNSAVTPSQDKAFSGWLSEKAMVVFDLSKNPAVVLTCNDAFCRLFGYQMENVIGMAWKKFIDQSYFERTMSILLQNNGAANRQTSSIQFMQVYKAGNGSTFVALDTHTFLYGTTGPRADLVTITPVQADHPNPSDQSFWPVTEAASPHPESPLPPGAIPSASSAASQTASNIAHAFSPVSESSTSSTYVEAQGDMSQGVGMTPPPVRRRKIVETPAYNPKVQEINSSDDSFRSPSPPPSAEASYAVGQAKPRKPRQPKAPKAASAANSVSEAPKAKRAGPGRPKRASAAAAAASVEPDSSASHVRIEEIPSDPMGSYMSAIHPGAHIPVQYSQPHASDMPGAAIILPPVGSSISASGELDPMLVDQTGPFGVNLPEYQEDEIFGLPGDVGPVFQPDDLGQSVENSEQYSDPNALFYDVFSS